MTEYVDHLHEHFVETVRVARGRYLLPQAPGYSAEIRQQTLDQFCYPQGQVWLTSKGVIG